LHALWALKAGNKVCVIGKVAQYTKAGGRVFALFCHKCGADNPQIGSVPAAQGHINSVGKVDAVGGQGILVFRAVAAPLCVVVQHHVAHRAGQAGGFAKSPSSATVQGLVVFKNEVACVAFKRYGTDVVQHAGHEHILARCTRKAQTLGKSLTQEGNPQVMPRKNRRNHIKSAGKPHQKIK
jgi:hypothetical protein